MSDVLKERVLKAEGDLRTATREFAAIDAPNYDAVCFHAEQCVEKLMKAVLIQRNITPPKTHDLYQLHLLLLPVCPGWGPTITDLRYLTRAAVDFRYPGESADREEAEEALDICSRLRENLFALLGKSF